MLNPDGVIVGNYRCSLSGHDLNRNYKTMLKDTFPPVWNIRNMIKKWVSLFNIPFLLSWIKFGENLLLLKIVSELLRMVYYSIYFSLAVRCDTENRICKLVLFIFISCQWENMTHCTVCASLSEMVDGEKSGCVNTWENLSPITSLHVQAIAVKLLHLFSIFIGSNHFLSFIFVIVILMQHFGQDLKGLSC